MVATTYKWQIEQWHELVNSGVLDGIPEYWVVDLKNKQLIVHTQPDRDKYLQIVTYNRGTITPQAFPNCQIALDKILLSF